MKCSFCSLLMCINFMICVLMAGVMPAKRYRKKKGPNKLRPSITEKGKSPINSDRSQAEAKQALPIRVLFSLPFTFTSSSLAPFIPPPPLPIPYPPQRPQSDGQHQTRCSLRSLPPRSFLRSLSSAPSPRTSPSTPRPSTRSVLPLA